MERRQQAPRRASAALADAPVTMGTAPEHLTGDALEGLAVRTAGIQLQPKRKRGRPRKTELRALVGSVWALPLKAAAAAKRKRAQQPRARAGGPAVGACSRLTGTATLDYADPAGLEGFVAGGLLKLKPHCGSAYLLEPLSRCAQLKVLGDCCMVCSLCCCMVCRLCYTMPPAT